MHPQVRLQSLFFLDDFFFGTLAPFFRALESPIATACFLLLTFLPDLPLFNVPFLRSRIAFSTSSAAFLPYLAINAPFIIQIGHLQSIKRIAKNTVMYFIQIIRPCKAMT